ncbi:hypothetical protein A2348_00145 [Candidatus Uhrbacteria bacterium RIFOXYB12_FULL_58_10]|uniref:DUF5673 domain-containing protein n=1 Tax=Candidatus Uhrbacteria bacterium RIFOXYB2_FULL_57_15 TaxID=1802422 RepID=A0A1F7W784_9BACT|nr:MAG: hypothetical protein A2348_00145 [Candidatus Uhrbacteria bacterium RIFOXYB12_FULL_58_10]OGL98639.1 MAG: hypothetical protein A2304_02955 [Candidatus Uhrbacteria bacterium RIFOXYB2_FULL_57_15]OGL99986.1 MAG: hypothetical protein A2501_02600 [Candidatus Uhrbacteria bacterium RIFOXYC12_FULL_57_11]
MEDTTQTTSFETGRANVAWEIDEYTRQTRSRNWYLVAGIIGVALIVYSIASANFLFAVIILMIGIITLITDFKQPDRVTVAITPTGLVVGDIAYDFRAVRDFSLAYEPPEVKILYLTFRQFWQPMLAIPLEDTDPNVVRAELLPYCLENLDRTSETLTETIKRVYKL